ncbi:MAG: hypothetical protein C4B55_01430 [Candidatus Methanophagaceae archaeon]|nr:MAG: hypothetical protein C4B55_01430 [Methanophagales archaeon]
MGEKGRKREGGKWKKRRLIGVAAVGAILVTTFASQAVCASVPLFNEAILRGYVFDTQGNPIQRALIEWRDSETMELFELTTTTYTGYYSTPHLFNDAGAVRSLITAAKTDFSTNSTIITTEPAFPPTFYELNFTLLEIAETGSININEIMYNPSTEQGSDTVLEWIELRNDDTAAVNLNGWTIATPEVGKITEEIILQPGGYAVLARNKDAFEAYYGAGGELSCSVVEVEMRLGNAEDTVVLKDGAGTEIDRVSYKDDWGADGNGKTLELIGAGGGWRESVADDGTPCAENSVVFMKPDLTVTVSDGSLNCGFLFGNESNEVCVTVENIGTDRTDAFNLSFDMNGFSTEERVAGGLVAGGNATTVCVADPTLRSAGDSVTVRVVADCNGEITESNETNNAASLTTTVVNNGYKGKRYTGGEDIASWKKFELNGDLLYSVGDSFYLSAYTYKHWTEYAANWTVSDLQVPDTETATVREARLYVPYTWDKAGVMPDEVSLTFNGVTQTLDAHYTDEKMHATSYPYGMLVYNVTEDLDTSASGNTAVLTNSHLGGGNVSIRGMLLTVIYADESEPLREIFVNEEFDLLYGGASKCTTPEEATAYAPFGTADTEDVLSATLVTVAPGAGPSEGELTFNGQKWTDVWSFAGATQIGIDKREVTSFLQAAENEAGFQSSADYFEPSNAILVVEHIERVNLNINEIMYNPSKEQGSDTVLEWLELRNDDTAAVNLNGWTIATPEVGKITEEIILQPGGYAVLARNKDAFENYYGAGGELSCSVVEVEMRLGNAEDTVVLKDGAGTEIDRVSYKDDWGADGNGKTLEWNATGWFESEVEGGTPCAENSVVFMKPDLTVTVSDGSLNCGFLFGNESNEVCVTVENIGTDRTDAFNLSFDMNGFSTEERVAGGLVAGGNATTVCVADPTLRSAGDSVTVRVVADCNGEITESNETNNAASLTTTVVNNGYKGKRYTGGEDIASWKKFELKGNLLYSVGDSFYLSSSTQKHWATYTANWTTGDLPVPETATVREARLYVPYTWDKAGVMPDEVSLTFNGVAQTLDAHYTDRKGYGSYDYPYGALAYNVTSGFDLDVRNTAVLTNTHPGGGNVSIRGMLLTVIYADESEPLREIFVNEEFDLLYGGASKCTTPEEATAYAPFGTANTEDVFSATLITVAPGAGPSEGELTFNGQKWTDVWSFAGATQIGIDKREVTAFLQAAENEAGFQSSADYFEPSNAFLVVEHKRPDLVVRGIKINPNGTRGEEIVRVYVNESNNLTAVVQNNGNADAGAFEVCFEVGSGVEVGCVNVAGLPAGANATVSTFWTPCCENYSVEPGFPARSLPTTVNVTADCTEKIPESDEANNLLSKFIPAVQQYAGYDVLGGVVNNGYKSKNFDCNATEEPLTLFEHEEELLGGGLALNVSGAKISSFDPGETSTRTHHIEIPEGATVKTARLYVYWYDKWGNYKQYPTGCLADLSVNFGGTEFAPAKKYNDQKGFGYYHSPKGTYTYNVTSKVREAGSGDYTAVVKNTDPKNSTTLLGEMLLVVYDDPAKTNLTQIWVLEGNDYLMSADETHNSYNYGVSPEEATATVKLPGNLSTAAANLSSVCSATLISVVAQGMSPGANLLFNGEVVKTDAWNTETEAYPNSKINLESLDVKPYLTLTASGNRGNSVGFQDTGTDGLQASNAILVVEYSEQEPLHPAVSISTDKTDYTPGETMQITLNLSNPTGTDQTVWFEWYFGIPAYSYWLPFVEPLPLNLPAGCEYSFPFSILVGNWGETGFDAVWLVNLSDPVTHKIISSDTAEWSYAPVPPATAVATAAVSSEQTRSVENFDEEMLGSGREIEKKLKAKLESETEKR